MHIRSVFALLLAAVLLAVPAAAFGAADSSPSLLYEEHPDGTAEITGLAGGSGALNIPAEIDGHAVTAIAAGAFRGTALTQVEVPPGVLSIGDEAFAGCAELQFVSLPSSAAELGTGIFASSSLPSFSVPKGAPAVPAEMFSGCTSLETVTIPASVTSVGENAFSGCGALQKVTYTGTREEFEAIEIASGNDDLVGAALSAAMADPAGILYNVEGSSDGDDLTVTIAGLADPEQTGAVVVPEVLGGHPVTAIGANAFERCRNISEVELPDSLVTIDRSAFQDCEALQSVRFGTSLRSLGAYAFEGCTALSSVTLPDTLEDIGSFAFAACTDLASAELPNTSGTPGEYLFAYSGLTSFRVPRGWTNIPKGTFTGCSQLASVTLPASIYSIGEEAFGACMALGHVYLLGSSAEADSIQIEAGNAPFESASKTVSNLVLQVESGPSGTDYITGAAVSTFGLPVSAVLPVLQAETSSSAAIYAAGEPASTDDIVGTGMTARWSDAGGTEHTAAFVIMGDVIGSGQLNIAQLVRLARAVTGDTVLSGPHLAAGDWNGSGAPDIADLMREAELFRTPGR